MGKFLKHKIKRLGQNLWIWSKRKLYFEGYDNTNLTEPQKKAIAICIRMINNPNSELLMTTTSEKRYVKYLGYFLVISYDSIQVVNHVYSYDVPLKGRKFDNIKNLFDKRLDEDRLLMEVEIRDNIKHSLNIVLESLKQTF